MLKKQVKVSWRVWIGILLLLFIVVYIHVGENNKLGLILSSAFAYCFLLFRVVEAALVPVKKHVRLNRAQRMECKFRAGFWATQTILLTILCIWVGCFLWVLLVYPLAAYSIIGNILRAKTGDKHALGRMINRAVGPSSRRLTGRLKSK